MAQYSLFVLKVQLNTNQPTIGRRTSVGLLCWIASGGNSEALKDSNDWVFQNYTYKRFQGLTQRAGLPFRTN